jgi:hypothetical protein
MADKKKTNLPNIIEKIPSTEMSRRDFLRGTGGAAIQGVLDTLPTGRIIDAIGKGGLSSLRDPKEKQLLIKLASLQNKIRNTIGKDPYLDAMIFGKSSKPDLFTNPEDYSEDIEHVLEEAYINYYESGAYYEAQAEQGIQEEHDAQMSKMEDIRDDVISYEKEWVDTTWELGGLHRKKYPKEIFDKMYKLPSTSGANRDWGTGKITLDPSEYSTEIPDLVNEISNILDWDEKGLTDTDINKDITRSIEKSLPPLLEAPEDKKDTVEDRIKQIAGAAGSQALSRALTQLAKPKDPKQKQIQKAKGSKQIAGPEKTEKPSINKLLSALSLFKRGTPLGAAAYVMGPTATAEDDDYGFEIPVDR